MTVLGSTPGIYMGNNYIGYRQGVLRVRVSLVPRPSRAPARKRVWNLSQDFLALLNQHDDVFYVIQNDCHVLWAYGPSPMRAYTLGNWNWNRAVFQYALKSHDSFESCVLIGLPVFRTC